ncbi:hypothetical protein [Streptosporangium sp. NPDC000396]|uniref:hypothetical protein n=1 Tax=Streptosporangium sp. NPDC000396 TaxID=3366185 RepID=UPI0036B5EFA6
MIGRLSPILSPRRRIRAVAALLTGLTGSIFVTALWSTEPGPLPGRTHLAFALLTLFCLAWTGYGAWAITRRAPLFALDRVIAAWLALAAALLMTVVMVVIAATRGTGVFPILAVNAVFVVVAVVLAVRAHARRAALLRRKRELSERGAP